MTGNRIGLVATTKDAASGPLAKIRQRADDLGTAADQTGGKLKGLGGALVNVAKVAAIGAAAIVAGGILAGKQLLTLGTRLEQMDAKADTVFGGQRAKVDAWAKANANAMGLTGREATGLAANFADLLIPMKFTREQATKMSTDVVGLSGALSQWSGGTRTAAEVSEILAKAMLGERDSLKELGISITEADVQARLLKKGQEDLTGAALEQAKAIATQELIFEKSTDAQAAYAKGTDTLIGKQAAAEARLRELVDTLAVNLLPVFHTVVSFMLDNVVPAIGDIVGKVQTWMKENKPLIDQLVKFAGGVLSTLVTAIGRVIDWIGKFVGAITRNKAIMDGLRALVGLIAKAFDTVTTAAGFVIGKIGSFVEKITSNKGTMNALKDVGNFIGDAFRFVSTWVGNVSTAIGQLGDKIRANKGLMDGLKIVARLIRDAFESLREKVSLALVGLRSIATWIANNLPKLKDLLGILKVLPGFSGVGGLIQGMHAGGPVHADRPVIVGEKGPELFVPMSAGSIVPNHRLPTGGGGGGAPVVLQLVTPDGRVLAELVDPHLSYRTSYQPR